MIYYCKYFFRKEVMVRPNQYFDMELTPDLYPLSEHLNKLIQSAEDPSILNKFQAKDDTIYYNIEYCITKAALSKSTGTNKDKPKKSFFPIFYDTSTWSETNVLVASSHSINPSAYPSNNQHVHVSLRLVIFVSVEFNITKINYRISSAIIFSQIYNLKRNVVEHATSLATIHLALLIVLMFCCVDLCYHGTFFSLSKSSSLIHIMYRASVRL